MTNYYIHLEFGYIKVTTNDNNQITHLIFISKKEFKKHRSNKEIKKGIMNYLSGKKSKLEIKLDGTKFQKLVWKAMLEIPAGETVTYSELAKNIGHDNSYRAVANACGQNKIALLVPCHRVISKNGIGGYEYGVELKEKILKYEINHC